MKRYGWMMIKTFLLILAQAQKIITIVPGLLSFLSIHRLEGQPVQMLKRQSGIIHFSEPVVWIRSRLIDTFVLI